MFDKVKDEIKANATSTLDETVSQFSFYLPLILLSALAVTSFFLDLYMLVKVSFFLTILFFVAEAFGALWLVNMAKKNGSWDKLMRFVNS
jgi:ABC-type multidrug transport system fused ATPase/permease subunit